MRARLLLVLPLLVSLGAGADPPTRRLAVSADGNYHDRDDIGATAMIEALIWRAGVQDLLVHYEHSNHQGANDSGQHADMEESATGNLKGFGINPAIVFDGQDPAKAASHLADEIEASTPVDTLVVIQCGPWELMAQAYDIANPKFHGHTVIANHSGWNSGHKHESHHRDKIAFLDQYKSGGKFDGWSPPTVAEIPDQNGPAFASDIGDWKWLANCASPDVQSRANLRFVWDRTVASDWAEGDMSDAGLAFWVLTGEDDASMDDIKDFFGVK